MSDSTNHCKKFTPDPPIAQRHRPVSRHRVDCAISLKTDASPYQSPPCEPHHTLQKSPAKPMPSKKKRQRKHSCLSMETPTVPHASAKCLKITMSHASHAPALPTPPPCSSKSSPWMPHWSISRCPTAMESKSSESPEKLGPIFPASYSAPEATPHPSCWP